MSDDYQPAVRNVVLADLGYYNALEMIQIGLDAARARLETLTTIERELERRRRNPGETAPGRQREPFAVVDPDKTALQLSEDDIRQLVIRQQERIKAGEAALKDFQDPEQYGYTLVRREDADRLNVLDNVNSHSKFTYKFIGDDGERRGQVKVDGVVLFTLDEQVDDHRAAIALQKLLARVPFAEKASGDDV